VGDRDSIPDRAQILAGLDYIRETPMVRDVLLSGGDPLTLGEDFLEWVIGELRSIDHVDLVRIGSRMPVVCPQRITPKLTEILKKYHPMWLNTHFNHPKEITPESTAACNALANAGVVLGNQSVLLKGVNDCPYLFRELYQQLLKLRVNPYYLFQCDHSEGIEHFHTSVGKGVQIMEFLRGHTTGLCQPLFIVEPPGGTGKIPVMPNYVLSVSDRQWILRNYEGLIAIYNEPEDNRSHPEKLYHHEEYTARQRAMSRDGLIKLFEGPAFNIIPKDSAREKRRAAIADRKARMKPENS
jgi:lysine 2,3-aminomutase